MEPRSTPAPKTKGPILEGRDNLGELFERNRARVVFVGKAHHVAQRAHRETCSAAQVNRNSAERALTCALHETARAARPGRARAQWSMPKRLPPDNRGVCSLNITRLVPVRLLQNRRGSVWTWFPNMAPKPAFPQDIDGR